MPGSDHQLDLRRQIGIALRFPVVAVLALLWLVHLWWWLAGLAVGAAAVMLVLQPLTYPLLYVFVYLGLAFSNSNEPVLPGYWKHYPHDYFEFCWKALRLGFPTLRRWLLQGFGSS